MQASRTILVLGASGMLGNALLRFFSESEGFTTVGTVRSARAAAMLPEALRKNVIAGIDVQDVDSVTRLLTNVRPDLVVNCVGVVKQLAEADDPLVTIPINSILPHRLVRLCALAGARLVHLSTDCVFSGKKGMYSESDQPDCYDLYGRSKLLGEVDYPNAITLRTSIIGHELGGTQGLLNWFLSQQRQVNGYTKAIFSGLPTVEIARIVRDYVLPNPHLRGVYQVSAAPIAKFDLLRLVAEVYRKAIEIVPDEHLVIDRSLNSERFRLATGYAPPTWRELVATMHRFG
jgi:dTDP-4-dehydrorhamnose reductase